jgi:glycosyltransferase involved in cell wall biosynthesis
MYRINIVLANNTPHSHTRIAIEYANELIKFGHTVLISYPVVSFYDFIVFEAFHNISQKVNTMGRLKALLLCGLKIFSKLLNPYKYKFLGDRMVDMDTNIILNRYVFRPTEFNMPDADVIMVNQDYLLKNLVGLPDKKGVLTGSVHADYKMVDKNRSIVEMYYDRMILLSKKIDVPRLAVSKTAMESAKNIGIRVDRVINNGVRESSCENREVANIIVMLFSSPRKEKGLNDGVEVISNLKKLNLQNISFYSIGEIDEKSSKLFDFNYGFVTGDNYFKALCKADIFIYPSLHDGFALPALEAISCQCALVTTLVAGVDEWAINDVNSLVVHPGDVEGMTNGVIRLIENPDLLTKISNNGVKVSKRYSWYENTKQLVDFFDFCVDDSHAGKNKKIECAICNGK